MRHERGLGVRGQRQFRDVTGPHETGQVLSKGLIYFGKNIPGGLESVGQRLAHSNFLAPLSGKDQRKFCHDWNLQIAPVTKGDRECKQALEKQGQMRFTPAFTRRHAALGNLE